jgi:hypothetical protein
MPNHKKDDRLSVSEKIEELKQKLALLGNIIL